MERRHKKDYWYKVKTHKNLVGWVYGGGLSFPNLDKRGVIIAKLSNKIADANKKLQRIKGCEIDEKLAKVVIQSVRAEDTAYLGITLDRSYFENMTDDTYYVTAFPLPNPHHFVLILEYRDYGGGTEAYIYNDEGEILSHTQISVCEGDAGDSWQADWEMVSSAQWKKYYKNSSQDIEDLEEGKEPTTPREYEEKETIIIIDEKGIINEKTISEKKYVEKI